MKMALIVVGLIALTVAAYTALTGRGEKESVESLVYELEIRREFKEYDSGRQQISYAVQLEVEDDKGAISIAEDTLVFSVPLWTPISSEIVVVRDTTYGCWLDHLGGDGLWKLNSRVRIQGDSVWSAWSDNYMSATKSIGVGDIVQPGRIYWGCHWSPADTGSFPLEVTNLTPSNYELAYLTEGDEYYIDRPYTISDIPSEYGGLLWIKTANTDKTDTSEDFCHFDVNQDIIVYVGYDQRAIGCPQWLLIISNEVWWKHGPITTDGASPYDMYVSQWSAGEIVLGGNMAEGVDWVGSMYVVLIKGSGQQLIPPGKPVHY